MLCAFRDLLSHRSIRRTPFKCRELIRQYPPHFLVNGKLRLTGNDLCLDKHKRKFSANTAAVLAKRLDLDIQFLAEFACKAFKRSFPQLCFSAGKFPQMRAGAPVSYTHLDVYKRQNSVPEAPENRISTMRYRLTVFLYPADRLPLRIYFII